MELPHACSGYDPLIHQSNRRIIEVASRAHAHRCFEQALTIDNNLSKHTVLALAIGRRKWSAPDGSDASAAMDCSGMPPSAATFSRQSSLLRQR